MWPFPDRTLTYSMGGTLADEIELRFSTLSLWMSWITTVIAHGLTILSEVHIHLLFTFCTVARASLVQILLLFIPSRLVILPPALAYCCCWNPP